MAQKMGDTARDDGLALGNTRGEDSLHAQAQERQHSLENFDARQLASTRSPIAKRDGHFCNPALQLQTCRQHFHQEGISIGAKAIDRELFYDMAAITSITRGPITGFMADDTARQ